MIYFKEAEGSTTLLELLNRGFSGPLNLFVETFLDPEYSVIQTNAFKRRSFSDLLEIARTYFPDTTEKELMLALKEAKTIAVFCGEVKKVTFKKNTHGGDFTAGTVNQDEVGLDGYTLNYLLNLLS
jgi:hypothetical protein